MLKKSAVISTLFTFSLSLSVLIPAHAQKNVQDIDDPYLATLWGALKTMSNFRFPVSNLVRMRSKDFEGSKLPEGGLPMQVALQTKGFFVKEVQKRPLIFYLPGFASNNNAYWVRYAIPRFYALGYHVVAIPNPMSLDWIMQRYHATPGDLVAEAKTEIKIMRSVVKVLGPDVISSVHVVGESYGAFLTSVVLKMDAEAPASMQVFDHIRSKALVVSPPFDFKRTLQRLDEVLVETRDIYENQCKSFGTQMELLYEMIKGDTSKFMANLRVCAKAVIAHRNFKSKALDDGHAYEDAWGVKISPKDPETYKRWRFDLLLLDFFKLFSPSASKLLDDADTRSVTFWLSEARKTSQMNINVVSTQDEILNDEEVWDNDTRYKTYRGTIDLYPRGGHMGYITSDIFQKKVEIVFPQIK